MAPVASASSPNMSAMLFSESDAMAVGVRRAIDGRQEDAEAQRRADDGAGRAATCAGGWRKTVGGGGKRRGWALW